MLSTYFNYIYVQWICIRIVVSFVSKYCLLGILVDFIFLANLYLICVWFGAFNFARVVADINWSCSILIFWDPLW